MRLPRTIPVLFLLVFTAAAVQAQPLGHKRPEVPRQPPSPGVWQKSLLGGQLGPWFTSSFGEDIQSNNYRLSGSSTAFHLEFFYMPHLTGPLNLDLSLGAVGRGDIRLSGVAGSNVSGIGTATLYPVGIGMAWFPLAKSVTATLQPMLRAGGSLVVGTEQVEAVLYDYYGEYLGYSSESRVALGFYTGAQLLWVLGPQFSLTGGVKYQYANFNEELFGVRDYSGMQVLIGAAYLYH